MSLKDQLVNSTNSAIFFDEKCSFIAGGLYEGHPINVIHCLTHAKKSWKCIRSDNLAAFSESCGTVDVDDMYLVGGREEENSRRVRQVNMKSEKASVFSLLIDPVVDGSCCCKSGRLYIVGGAFADGAPALQAVSLGDSTLLFRVASPLKYCSQLLTVDQHLFALCSGTTIFSCCFDDCEKEDNNCWSENGVTSSNEVKLTISLPTEKGLMLCFFKEDNFEQCKWNIDSGLTDRVKTSLLNSFPFKQGSTLIPTGDEEWCLIGPEGRYYQLSLKTLEWEENEIQYEEGGTTASKKNEKLAEKKQEEGKKTEKSHAPSKSLSPSPPVQTPSRHTKSSASKPPLHVSHVDASQCYSRMIVRVSGSDGTEVSLTDTPRSTHIGDRDKHISSGIARYSAIHPFQSQATINSAVAPVDCSITSTLRTDDDDTNIRIEWVDVQRLVSLQLDQHIYVGERRKKLYQQKFAQLEEAVNQLELEKHALEEREAVLDKRATQLTEGEEKLKEGCLRHEEGEKTLQEREERLDQEEGKVKVKQAELDAAIEHEKEMEGEAEKRRRQERERQRQHERQLENEHRQEEKLQQRLQAQIDQQQIEQVKLQRETDRMTREREQYKRDAAWGKEKEELWNQDRAQLEKKNAILKSEVELLTKNLDAATYELKDARSSEGHLKEEVQKLNLQIDYYNGRRPQETDSDWSKRVDAINRLQESSSHGRIVQPGLIVDMGMKVTMTSFALGDTLKTAIFPSIAVTLQDPVITSAQVAVEIGEGYVCGDVLSVDHVADDSFFLNSQRVGSVEIRDDFVLFTVEEMQNAGKIISSFLCSLRFRTNSTRIYAAGARSMECFLSISTTKQSIQCPFLGTLVVTPPLVESFKDPASYVERTASAPLFAHQRVINPFGAVTVTQMEEQWGSAFLHSGVKGPNLQGEVSDVIKNNLFSRYFARIGARCLTCNQLRKTPSSFPRQTQEVNIFGGGEIKLRLNKVQDGDKIFYKVNEDISPGFVEISNTDDEVIVIRVLKEQLSKSQLQAILHSIHFSSSSVPLEDKPRELIITFNFPNFRIPANFCLKREIQIVNCAHEVTVSFPRTDLCYRVHSVGVNAVEFDPPSLYFAAAAEVVDPFQSRFSGRATAKIVNGVDSHDLLSIRPTPAYAEMIQVEQDIISYNGTRVGTLQRSSNSSLEIIFSTRTTMVIAQLVLRSLMFSTTDTNVRNNTKKVQLEVNLGRGSPCSFTFSILLKPSCIYVAKHGGLKWTEHQGPVLAATQLALGTNDPQEMLIHCSIINSYEEGDEIGLLSSVVQSPSPLDPLYLQFCDTTSKVISTQVILDDVVAYVLEDKSMVFRLGRPLAAVDWVSQGDNQPISVPKIQQLLQSITYFHNTINPSQLKKILAVRCIEYSGTYSDAYLPLQLVPVDDPTEINDVPASIIYCQGSALQATGFTLLPTAKLFDPDTEDFIGGFFSVEQVSGIEARDELYFLSVEQQQAKKLTDIVHVDEDDNVHLFHSMEELSQYEENLQRNILFDENLNVTQHCVGQVIYTSYSEVSEPPQLAKQTSLARETTTFVLPSDKPDVPQSIAVNFTPLAPRVISLDDVQAVLRAIAFENNSNSLREQKKMFLVKLGAGQLSAQSSSVDGATVAEHTELRCSVVVVPSILYTPDFCSTAKYTSGSGLQFVTKSLSVVPPTSKVSFQHCRIVAKLELEPTPEEYIVLQLKKETGSTALELNGNVILMGGKREIAQVTHSKAEFEVKFSQRMDVKTMQQIVRSIGYCNGKPSSRRQFLWVEIHDALGIFEAESVEEEKAESQEQKPTEEKATEESPKEEVKDASVEKPSEEKETEQPGKNKEDDQEGSSPKKYSDDEFEKCSEGGDEKKPQQEEPTEQDSHASDPTTTEKEKVENESEKSADKPRSEVPFLPVKSQFCCRVRIETLDEVIDPLKVFATESNLEYVVRSGAAPILSTVKFACPWNKKILRSGLLLSIIPPFAVKDALSLQEDLKFQVDKETNAIYCNKHIVAHRVKPSSKVGGLCFMMRCCPPPLLQEIVNRVVYSGSKKDRGGTKLSIKVQLVEKSEEIVSSQSVTFLPSYIDEMNSTAQFVGQPLKPFQLAKIHSPIGFTGGKLVVDLYESEVDGLLATDYVSVINSPEFNCIQLPTKPEEGVINFVDGNNPFAKFEQSKVSIIFSFTEENPINAEDVQSFVQNCIILQQTEENIDFNVRYVACISLADRGGTRCGTQVNVVGNDPNQKKKKKK